MPKELLPATCTTVSSYGKEKLRRRALEKAPSGEDGLDSGYSVNI
jgi:hypothetical protein